MKKIILMLSMILSVAFSFSHLYAHEDTIVHPKITERAALAAMVKDNLPFDVYLFNNLGFSGGLSTLIPMSNGKPIFQLLTDGSIAEDDPRCRAANHFHNPLKTWGTSMMSDQPLWLNIYCSSWQPLFSNVTWATGLLSPTGPKATFNANPDLAPNTWDKAKSYYQAVENRPSAAFPHHSSLRHTNVYASLFMISETSHLSIFEQPECSIYETQEATI